MVGDLLDTSADAVIKLERVCDVIKFLKGARLAVDNNHPLHVSVHVCAREVSNAFTSIQQQSWSLILHGCSPLYCIKLYIVSLTDLFSEGFDL